MTDKSTEDDNVIHVRFGPEGGRRVAPLDETHEDETPNRRALSGSEREPYAELFRRREVSELFKIPEGRLRYWDRSGFIQPSGKLGRRRFYTFEDLIGIRVANSLLSEGTPLSVIRRNLDALVKRLPDVTRPLNELRIVTDGQSLVVRDQDMSFEPDTGQLHLDFEVQSLRDDVVRVLRPRRIDPEQRKQAYERYLEGCRLDDDEATFDDAEEHYRAAIRLDPGLSNALTNWGNLCFRRGQVDEAKQLYERALKIDDEQPEALYNLGFLAFEGATMEDAVGYFQRATECDPGFADAYFNLAMALEELGRSDGARAHWKSYLELDPAGPWAEIARRHLDATWRERPGT